MIGTIILVALFLCWGSFLNVVGYRLLSGTSFITPRSACPQCSHTLAWYDLMPVISWIILRGRCRYCKQTISWLYPVIEVITALLLTLMIYRFPEHYWLAYGFFFSALIVNIRTDLQDMVISRFVSLYAIPLGILAAWLNWLPISLLTSLLGALVGYGVLWTIATIFKQVTDKDGMGTGDFELLAFIGSFIGIGGIAPTIFIASLVGATLGIILIICKRAGKETKIPFGPFLALGAIVYTFCPTLFARLL